MKRKMGRRDGEEVRGKGRGRWKKDIRRLVKVKEEVTSKRRIGIKKKRGKIGTRE